MRLDAGLCREVFKDWMQWLEAGLPIQTCIWMAQDQLAGIEARPWQRKAMRNALAHLHRQLHKGGRLSDGMLKGPHEWPALARAWVLLGEKTGQWAAALGMYVQWQSTEHALHRRMAAALSYPVWVMGLSACLAVFLSMYLGDDSIATPPQVPASRSAHNGEILWGLWLGAGAALVVLGFLRQRWARPRPLLKHLPRIPASRTQGFRQLRTASDCYRALGTLCEAGLPLTDALEFFITQLQPLSKAHPSVDMQMHRLKKSLARGDSLKSALTAAPWPALASRLAGIAEQTGDIARCFFQLAEHHLQASVRAENRWVQSLGPMGLAAAATMLIGVYLWFIAPMYAQLESL